MIFWKLACSSRTEMSLELLLMSESSLEENCRFADDVTADENRKSERCGIDGGGVSLLLLQQRGKGSVNVFI